MCVCVAGGSSSRDSGPNHGSVKADIPTWSGSQEISSLHEVWLTCHQFVTPGDSGLKMLAYGVPMVATLSL